METTHAPLPLIPLHSIVHMNDWFSRPLPPAASNELGDALTQIGIHLTPPGPTINNAWNWHFIERFSYNNDLRSVYIQVLDYINLTQQQKSKPILVIPMWYEEDLQNGGIKEKFPTTGYYWDSQNNVVVTMQIPDDDFFEDDVNYYKWKVDHAYSGTATGPGAPTSINCTGDNAPSCGDKNCESECGESWPACIDCDPARRKTLRLSRIAFNLDKKVKGACANNNGQSYRESYNKKDYEINMAYLIIKANGKTVSQGENGFAICTDGKGELEFDRVNRCKEHKPFLQPCQTTCNNGGASWVQVSERDKTLAVGSGRACTSNDLILDENFNPNTDRLYIFFYEDDYAIRGGCRLG